MLYESAQAFGIGRQDGRHAKRNLLAENYKGADLLPNESAKTAVKFWIYQRGGLVMDYKVSRVLSVAERKVLVMSANDDWTLTLSDDWTQVMSSTSQTYGNPVPMPIAY